MLYAESTGIETVDEIEMMVEERMENSVSALSNSLSTLRTGRASPAILDRVMVSYYGADTPLNSLATVSVSSAQQLTIQPFDKGSSGDIEKAIIESDLGLTPNNNGDLIRINIPSLTEERRKEMVKLCKSMGEEAKVSVRNARRDGVEKVKKLEKAKEISEDNKKDGEESMQKLADSYVKKVDELCKKKEEDVLKV
ncbi:hypothetical protein TrCOL_g6978 [Triparma columacea]|uniref:Ribosome recycling factor domain-containing protein n=1 Tax=Triparma columacea TaxID=722753 RepID=A0A9W7G7R9_9STRA|nr:hypothetical protein TrCOL_g6978 [Triparma columacea]